MRATLFFYLMLLGSAAALSGESNDPAHKKREAAAPVRFKPVSHASFVIEAGGKTIYVDPVGKQDSYREFPAPDLVLITHEHHDHMDPGLLTALNVDRGKVVAPASVTAKLGYGVLMANGEKKTVAGFEIEAVPMYNTTPERLKFHPRGKGNGYVITIAGKRVYIAGDTEDIPEMRALKEIDFAFIPMNLPYTMTVEQAASAVLAFRPRVVFPYHYRGRDAVSDVQKFKKLVTGRNPDIDVRLLKWY